MFAKSRELRFSDGTIMDTPLLVPSFSSKGFPSLQKTFDVTREYITDEILVSAYDVGRKLKPSFDFATAVFLDSGGYEASKELDMSDTYETEYQDTKWSIDDYQRVIDQWTAAVPTVFVSYDTPNNRVPIEKQIKRAKSLRLSGSVRALDFLVKPETKNATRLDMKNILAACKHFDDFQVIGVTEKEIGNGLLDRMLNIASLRTELNKHSPEKPIHVFGSLDTLTTFMYFIAGADIFDGLTWLRYAFLGGDTIYRHSFGALTLPVSTNSDIVEARCWSNNYQYLQQMRLDMLKFLNDGRFDHFGPHAEIIRAASESLDAKLAGGRNGR
nr:hypothetical protein [Mesorhizobium sp.]